MPATKPAFYSPDVLGADFEQCQLPQPDDYEGAVLSTLIRLRPVASATKAVLYVHGFNDYFFQQEMARRYQQHGYQFYAIDLRKYGRSWLPHQRPNNVRDLAEYFADLDAALVVIQKEGFANVLLSGHSTGGLVAALYAQEGTNRSMVSALFLNSPFLAMNQPWVSKHVAVPLVAGLGRLVPDLKVPNNLPTAYGESLHQHYRGEWSYHLPWKPLVVFSINAGWLRAIHRGHQRIRAGLSLQLPILVMHSAHSVHASGWSDNYLRADGVLNVCDISQLAPRLGSRVTVRAIRGGLHDLVLSRPPVREHVYDELFAWLATHDVQAGR